MDKNNPYRFALPPTWREQQVANIQSGNYCQPRCAEPWTEVIFSDSTEGRAQVPPLVANSSQTHQGCTLFNAVWSPVCAWSRQSFKWRCLAQILVSPLLRLTNASEAKIEDIGPPAGLLNSLGSYITGTNLEEEDVVRLARHIEMYT